MKLIQRLFGKTKPDPKVTSKPKGPAKAKKPKVKAPAPANVPATEVQEMDAQAQALIKTLEARRANDPMIMVKACATEMLNRLILSMRDKRGVQAESMLTALGALGGFACQMGARANAEPVEPRTVQGKTYFFGPAINKPLAENATSIFSMAKAAAEAMGTPVSIDAQEIFKHTIDTMGTNTYGIPRLPEKNKPRDLPENYARALWPVLVPTIKLFTKDGHEWPIIFAYAIQQVMKQSKDVLPPALAVTIVMEAAVPCSKLDPGPDVAALI
jgi:hypothetical protein